MEKEQLIAQCSEIINPYDNKKLNFNELIINLEILEDKVIVELYNYGDDSVKNKIINREIIKTLKINMGFKFVKLTNSNYKKDIENSEKTFKILLVGSGKGGVGKSTITTQLAQSLVQKNKKVAIMDLDIYGYSIPKILNLYSEPQVVDGKIIPLVSNEGIEVISAQYFIENNENQPIMWRAPKILSLMKTFFYDVKFSDELDYLIIDLPPGTGDIILNLTQFIDDAISIIVTTPQADASHVAIRSGVLFKELGFKTIGVVENMSYYQYNDEKLDIFGEGGGRSVATELDTNVIGKIPINQNIDYSYYDELIKRMEEYEA